MFSKATIKERRQYYREEWDPKDLPDFISTDIKKREFGFDHNGRGPNDRYKVFRGTESLRKFLRFKAPFAAYISVAFYNNPRRRRNTFSTLMQRTFQSDPASVTECVRPVLAKL